MSEKPKREEDRCMPLSEHYSRLHQGDTRGYIDLICWAERAKMVLQIVVAEGVGGQRASIKERMASDLLTEIIDKPEI